MEIFRTRYDDLYYLVYKTTNLINDKIYIGYHKTKKLKDSYLGSGIEITPAIKKYGRKNFKREIIEFCTSLEHMAEREIWWVAELDATNPEIGYNLHEGGCGGDIYNSLPINTQNKIKKAVSVAHKGIRPSEESIRSGAEKRRGKPSGNTGKKHIATTKRKNSISIALTGKSKSETHKQHLREANLGKTQTQETKDKHSETCTKQVYKDKIKITWDNMSIKICPHCGFQSKNMPDMLRWHFNNCKHNPNRNISQEQQQKQQVS